ncbi:MAG TPA: hypothetical protein VKK79_22555, partial [Candidatus Lokiarchaeia archaeon]|nr:hypothetical protein [Candidatus Lokiarchaeia archaeon]
GYDPASPHIEWTPQNASLNKKELGLWSEIYSGQFPDYRETLYESRVEGDISNRLSEMHIILRNSALIYMDPDNYDSFFINDEVTPDSTGYMFNYLIIPTIRIRTISFAMIVVTSRIDQNAKMLIDEKYLKQPLKKIKDDLEKTTRLKNILQGMISPFFTDLSRSYRQHYTAVLHRLVDLYDIEKNWTIISQKVATNIQELNSIFLDKQEDAQKRQEKILSLVNVLLGASIVFEIVDILVPVEPAHTFAKQIVAGILGIVIVVLLVSFLRKSKD